MSRLDELKQGIVDIVKKNIVYRWSTCSRATCQCDMKIKC